jgi:type VI secretion system protein ImpL
MSKKNIILIGSAVALFGVAFTFVQANVNKIPGLQHANPYIIQGIIVLFAIVGGAAVTWLATRGEKPAPPAKGAGAAAEEKEVTDLDDLLAEAEARLAVAQQEKDSKLSKLPGILLIGETGSAKTTSMVHSGTEPESLSGQVYEENNILPTPTANFWFAHHTVFVEMAGKLLGDGESWKKVIGRLQPPKAAALLGTAEQVPRAVLVCVDAETLLAPSPDPLAVSARKLRGQLTELSQQLGINLPVYVLFTRTDRLPYFTEYVSKLNNEEATRILGMTLPVVGARQGIYAEQETNRLSGAFEKLFRSLCNARPAYLSRESREADPAQLDSVYEFPREFRKLRQAAVRFLVELCRPSQLTVGPFLRGFYFSGVRPIIVNEMAPAAPTPAESQAAAGRMGATGMFRYGAAAQPAGAAPRVVGTKKVPQWLFLSHFFTDLLLADAAAKSASSSSIRASLPRRILLLSAAALCLFYSIALVISFRQNRTLAGNVSKAAQAIASVENTGSAPASLDSLQRLETLRQSLATLTRYNRTGAPWSYRWGLYIGNDLYPEVRKLYFADFGKLLLAPTQNIMVDFMKALPNTPTGPPYAYSYDTLKAYLETTSNPDKSTRSFLPAVLLERWSANRNVDPQRLQLAEKQFDFYTDELKIGNPLSSANDAMAISKARFYLNLFAGLERVYNAMLADAAKAGPVINFNKRFPGSAEEVVDNQDVASPFTKPGWDFMKNALKDPAKYAPGERWVLGEQASTNAVDVSTLGPQLANRYYADYINQWREYMKGASVVHYASLPDASKKLAVTSGNQSPLLELFWLCSQNVPADQPDIAKAFQPVTTVVPQSSVDRYIAASNQSYMQALVTLQAAVDSASQQTPVSDATANSTLANASTAKVAAVQIGQAFAADTTNHIDTMSEKLLQDPITYLEGLLRKLGPDQLNGAGKAFCSIYRPVMNKYPFNTAASAELTVAEINSIFHPRDGSLWKFYDDNLQKLLVKQGSQYVAQTVNGVTLTPSFVNFFNNAVAFADFVYAGNSPDPHFTYTLKPTQSEGITSGSLELDGQNFAYAGGDAAPKQFVWQPSGVHAAKGTVKFGTTDLTWSDKTGLWAIFRFFNDADTWTPKGTDNVLGWIQRTGKNAEPLKLPSGNPLTVRFELDMGGGPQIFSKGYFSRMACVAEVAK